MLGFLFENFINMIASGTLSTYESHNFLEKRKNTEMIYFDNKITICIAIIAIILLFAARNASSAELFCRVTDKYDFEKIYSETEIDKWKYSAKIEDHGNKALVSRCYYTANEGKVTCDRYEVDRIEYDENVNVKKYYIFSQQYNIQIYFKNLLFVEDNGRGAISYGNCIVTSP
jgi:hypothetical protein